MMGIKYEILVSRVFDFQKVEIKAISDQPLSSFEANILRQDTAWLADEALRELKITLGIEKERDKLFRKINDLEEVVSKFPQFADGENYGLIDPSGLSSADREKLREYISLREELAATKPYNYSDNQNFEVDGNEP